MQDIHSLSGGATPAAARLFAAAAAAGDRHLGLHHHPSNQPLKCPRCDSLNTKFCYYNNYNLSQPRHFCKSCRRYWTKGGVLRKVPVGGGCRKSRRSSSSKSSSSKPPPSPSTANPKPLDDSATTSAANNNHSSSDISTHTSAAPAEIPTLFHEYGSTYLDKPTMVPATEKLYRAVDITLDSPISSGVGRDDVSTCILTEIGNLPLDDSATTSAVNNNHSSSDSSTHTAAAPAEIPTLFHEYGSTCLEKPTTVPATETLYRAVDITLDRPISSGVGRDDVSTCMLTEIGNFTGLMGGSTAEITPFGYTGVLTQHDHPQQEIVVVDGFGPLDWQGSGDENNGVDLGEGLFDMTGAVDHAYWSHQNQWTAADVDVDHHHQQQSRGGLFLP